LPTSIPAQRSTTAAIIASSTRMRSCCLGFDMLFYGLEGSISGPLQQQGSGSSSGFTQYTSTPSARSPFSITFSSPQAAALRPCVVHPRQIMR
jgi:hypothetical protein